MEESCESTINILPDEVILIVFQFSDIHDMLQFSSTCKRFYDLVQNNNILWRKKFKQLIPNMHKTIEKHSDGDYFYELVQYYKHKSTIFAEIATSSKKTLRSYEPKFWENDGDDYSLNTIRNLVLLAYTGQYTLYYTVHILQNAIKNNGKGASRKLKDYEIDYAKCCLRYIMHLYLAAKWAAGEKHLGDDLTPVIVVNFFQQWVDPENLYLKETDEQQIQDLMTKVNHIIEEDYPSTYSGDAKKPLRPKIRERHILEAISKLIYQEMQIRISGDAALNDLNVQNVLKNRIGNIVGVAAIYQELATRCGVKCELVTFTNHLFLEWQEGNKPDLYTVDLSCGVLEVRRPCPFGRYSEKRTTYHYCPESLLLYMYSFYHSAKNNDIDARNASYLMDFLGTGSNKNESYKHLLSFLLEYNQLSYLQDELSLQYISEKQRHLFISLAFIGLEGR